MESIMHSLLLWASWQYFALIGWPLISVIIIQVLLCFPNYLRILEFLKTHWVSFVSSKKILCADLYVLVLQWGLARYCLVFFTEKIVLIHLFENLIMRIGLLLLRNLYEGRSFFESSQGNSKYLQLHFYDFVVPWPRDSILTLWL